MAGLNDRQRLFVAEYLNEPNATKAAILANYSEKTAYSQGQRLLKNVEVKAAIDAAQTERLERLGVRADWVLEKLVENVNRSMRATRALDADGEPIGDFRYEGTVANKSLELLGKHLKLFTEKVEHSGAGGGPIRVIEVVDAGGDEGEDEDPA